MAGMTVQALNALQPGEKLLAGNAVHVRCNTDSSVSVTLRVKRDGKQHDIKAGVFHPPFDKKTLVAIDKAVLGARENADALIAAKTARKPQAADEEAPQLTDRSTMRDVYADFLADVKAGNKWSVRNTEASADRVRKYLEPWAQWSKPASATSSADVKRLLSKLADTPAQQKKIRGLLTLAFTHAQELGHIEVNPVDAAVRMLKNTSKADEGPTHHPALVDIEPLRKLYKSFDQLAGSPSVRNALKLQALTGQRTGEVIGARWDEFQLEGEEPTWTIPRSRMKIKSKKRGDHVLALSKQAVEFLGTIKKETEFLFPGRGGEGHVTDNAISQAMRRDLKMADIHTPHGWRSSIRTLGTSATDEKGVPKFAESWLEALLDHQPDNAITAAYQRGQQKMIGVILQWWANELTGQ